jgi:GAF domain-containing protein
MVRVGAWQGSALEAIVKSFPRPAHETVTGTIIEERRVVHLPDVQAMASVPASVQSLLDAIGNYSALWAPLLRDQRGIGSIMLMRQPPKPFTAKEIALAETFADQAVIAIQNARLFRETQEARARRRAPTRRRARSWRR